MANFVQFLDNEIKVCNVAY